MQLTVWHSLFLEADSHSAGQEIPVFYRTHIFINVSTKQYCSLYWASWISLSLSLSLIHIFIYRRSWIWILQKQRAYIITDAIIVTLEHGSSSADNSDTYDKTAGSGEALNL
jgi:hypothetical protein